MGLRTPSLRHNAKSALPIVHAAAVLVAAIPSALLLGIFGRPHALRLAALTGVLVAAASFIPSFLHPAVRRHLNTAFYVMAGIDSLKMVLILVLLTWLVGKLPSNNAFELSEFPRLKRAAGALSFSRAATQRER